MLPCAYKSIFGIDCPGCGFQRAFIALLKGNIGESLHLYPAVIPILITAAVLLADTRYRFDRNLKIRKGLYIFTGLVIAVSYVSKMVLLYYHH
jgi:hypothetical protein